LKFSRSHLAGNSLLKRKSTRLCMVLLGVAGLAIASMPAWIQNIEVRSLLESAIFRTVSLPGGPVTIRRPPGETVPALTELIKSQPHPEELYSLRALEEEQKLDFTSAEADWKRYLQTSSDQPDAELALADFYHRRHRPLDEVNALSSLGRLPALPEEKLTVITGQRSWKAFERIFRVIPAQALGKSISIAHYKAWIERYPQATDLYGRYFEYLLSQKELKAAEDLISSYQSKFPDDQVFLIRARALLAYKQGSVERALAIYDKGFQPLWPPELVKNYFELLTQTHSLGRFLERARVAFDRNPDDLNAVCRIFFYYQQKGNPGAAQQAFTEYRVRKDSRKAPWTSRELHTLAELLESSNLYPEAARYYFALYNSKESADTQAKATALAGLAKILLAAPEQYIRLGSSDLSMYSDIATMDTGPGYLNGILSLILNRTSPDSQYAEEQQRAVPYFHRARAAELIALLDKQFPNSAARPSLHATLIEAYASYGATDSVVRLGREFLAAFPQAEQRKQVALLMADTYAKTENTKEEFAMYDFLLQELARRADGVPLGENIAGIAPYRRPSIEQMLDTKENGHQEREDRNQDDDEQSESRPAGEALSVRQTVAAHTYGARSAEYSNVLDRYLSRLAIQNAVPQALAVLRQELNRNPNDPGLYEKLAQFLEQNELGTEEEAIYRRAMQQFPSKSWYHKLARWYVRTKQHNELQSLTKEVAKIFSGMELEDYFRSVAMPSEIERQLNIYANQRFPHNLAFVHNLLNYYRLHNDEANWEALVRQHWLEDPTLRNQFFEYLSRKGKLEAELEGLKTHERGRQTNWQTVATTNPAAARFAGEAELWKSHFEEGAPALGAVAALYPAQLNLGREASSVYRSLAYFNPKNTDRAVQIELNLLAVDPQSRDTLARIGDIYSDREQFKKAFPYWNRMAETEPGHAQSYEEAATVFWDYYYFDDALRLLNKGRAKLGNNRLYGYETGAIYEAKRDYQKAVEEYVAGASVEEQNSNSYNRLLQLATRRSTRGLVDAATQRAATQGGHNLNVVRLRVDVLVAQSRAEEVTSFLNSVLDRSNSAEVLEGIAALAQEKSLTAVREHALEREVALSNDPIQRLQLRYALTHFFEDQKNLAAAERNVDFLYRENPKILGVVRATVDFYWRNKKQQRAIDVLMQAAEDSYSELHTKFTYEAARKMTEARQYEAARKLLTNLLQESPYDGEYAAAVADTYARAGDNAGLRDFYADRISFFRQANISLDERKSRIAELRRSLIPALTAIKDYAGAVDQYIEIVNAYPDDESVTTEAALYAQRHERKQQLLNFYSKTVAASPKDWRWPVVLARLQTTNEDFEAAIQTYSEAIKIRPDRADLLSARATLEERLMRFDEAATDYGTLYDRTYHDARWMERVAEVRARQGRTELVVQALKTAFVDGHPESAAKYFCVAEHLEHWGMLVPAREYAEHGIAVAGSDLLANVENHFGAELYARIMTRLRLQETAWQKLEAAVNLANQPPPLPELVEKKGMAAITDREWRENILRTRQKLARMGMADSLSAMGSTVGLYFTPEEKEDFLRLVTQKNAAMPRSDAYRYLAPLAGKAGLADFQAKLMYEGLVALHFTEVSFEEFVQLQLRRLKLAELGQQLEEISKAAWASTAYANDSDRYLNRAADTYHLAGMPKDELRVLAVLNHRSDFNGRQQERFFELLLAHDPADLVYRARNNDKEGDAIANFILAHGDIKLAREAINARSAAEDPVWRPAYSGLMGLYFADASPQVRASFLRALTDQSIGQRVQHHAERSDALAGDVWFYYGARFGEYLGVTHKGDPEDFVAAELEQTPAQSDAYFNIATYYQEIGDLPHALEDYQHALDLNPKGADIHIQLARIAWKQKRNDAALHEWKQALEILKEQTNSRDLPQAFTEDFGDVCDDLVSHQLMTQFHSQVDGVLHGYVKAGWSYGVIPLLRKRFSGSNDPKAVTALIMELSGDTGNADSKLYFLELFVEKHAKLKLQPEPIYRQIIELSQEELMKNSTGIDSDYARSKLEDWQIKWLEFLLDNKQYERLKIEMAPLAKRLSQDKQDQLVKIQLRVAAATNGLDSLLEGYRDKTHTPNPEVLKETARQIQAAGNKPAARKILEFVFRREVEDHNLTAANMLALAEIRIEDNDFQSAVELLRRMTLVAGAPFETQDPAAALLMRTGHPQEAAAFLRELVKAVPWNAEYRVRLARAQIAANQDADTARKELASVISDNAVSYEVRKSGATALRGTNIKASLGSGELNLLSTGQPITAEEANQPFFFEARFRAAEKLDPVRQAQLLRSALEDYPQGDSVRLPLLRATMKAGDYHLAIATIKPLVQNYWLEVNSNPAYYSYYEPYVDDPETEIDAETDTDADTDALEEDDPSETTTDWNKQPVKQRAEIARTIGLAFKKLDELHEALTYLQQASRLETVATTRNQINLEIQGINKILERRAENRSRQPVVHDDLEQKGIVRPRLPAIDPVQQRAAVQGGHR
jgi:tetratricopeptide (TPR) repeat protein